MTQIALDQLVNIIRSLGQTHEEFANNIGASKSLIDKILGGYAPISKGTEAKIKLYLDQIDFKQFTDKMKNNFNLFSNKSIMGYQNGINLFNQNSSSRPYYIIDAFGTTGVDIIDQSEQRKEPSYFISVPELKDVDIYIRVSGDSMYPKYRHGDIIGIKKLNEKEFFVWYEPYVIITKGNYQRLLKYIHPHPSDKNKLLLVSLDKEKFSPQPIIKDDIYQIWSVLGKIEI